MNLSELDSRVFLGLEAASEWLSLDDVHNVCVQRLNARMMQARSSSINVLLGVSDEFTPTASPYDITSLIGKSVPAFLEVRYLNQSEIAVWQQVRIVPLNALGDYQAMGVFAASFYGEELNDDTSQAVQYLAFTFVPGGVCRIRFDREGERIALNAAILLPDNLSELVVLESQNSLISRIKFNIGMDMRRDKELREIAPALLGALDGIYMQNMMDIKPLNAQWAIWAFKDRAVESNFNLPTPDGSGLYAGVGTRGRGGFNGGSY